MLAKSASELAVRLRKVHTTMIQLLGWHLPRVCPDSQLAGLAAGETVVVWPGLFC